METERWRERVQVHLFIQNQRERERESSKKMFQSINERGQKQEVLVLYVRIENLGSSNLLIYLYIHLTEVFSVLSLSLSKYCICLSCLTSQYIWMPLSFLSLYLYGKSMFASCSLSSFSNNLDPFTHKKNLSYAYYLLFFLSLGSV